MIQWGSHWKSMDKCKHKKWLSQWAKWNKFVLRSALQHLNQSPTWGQWAVFRTLNITDEQDLIHLDYVRIQLIECCFWLNKCGLGWRSRRWEPAWRLYHCHGLSAAEIQAAIRPFLKLGKSDFAGIFSIGQMIRNIVNHYLTNWCALREENPTRSTVTNRGFSSFVQIESTDCF